MKNLKKSQRKYEARQAIRKAKKLKQNQKLKSFDEIYTYINIYKAGIACQVHVKWKRSTQIFRREQVLRTHENFKRIQNLDTFKPLSNLKFSLNERGKIRDICAPQIDDRQLHKVACTEVYPIIYGTRLIDNNPASLLGKGLAYFQKKLKEDLRYHYRRYGFQGYIIILDIHNFFGSARHDVIKQYHKEYILDDKLRIFMDKITEPEVNGIGQNIGYEPSQFEMIFYTTPVDTYMTCQMHLKGYGHYMDDFYMLVPPNKDPHQILDIFTSKLNNLGLQLNEKKIQILRFGKPFRICKAKYIIKDTGKIIEKGSRDTLKRARHKIKSAQTKIKENKMTYEDLYCIVNNAIAYYRRYDDNAKILRIRRLVYSLYGIRQPDKIVEYRNKDLELAGT